MLLNGCKTTFWKLSGQHFLESHNPELSIDTRFLKCRPAFIINSIQFENLTKLTRMGFVFGFLRVVLTERLPFAGVEVAWKRA